MDIKQYQTIIDRGNRNPERSGEIYFSLKLKSMLRYRMPHYLFTFRPQISEQDLFENFITIFLPQLKTMINYAYTIEEDGTLQKHIHTLVECKAKDNNAFSQLFNKKIFKDFKSSLLTKQTNDHGFDNRKVQDAPEDFLKVLGYVMKEPQALRRGYSYPDTKILEARNYYLTTDHIEKLASINNDWTILTTKNAHVIIENYVDRNKMDWTKDNISSIIKLRMIKDKYSFINFTKDKQAQLFNELIICHTEQNIHSKHFKVENSIHEEIHKEWADGEYVHYLQKLLSKNGITISDNWMNESIW